MKAQRLDLAIAGMHCAGCVARVEKVLRSLPGVQEAQVNLATETAALHYEPNTVQLDEVRLAPTSSELATLALPYTPASPLEHGGYLW